MPGQACSVGLSVHIQPGCSPNPSWRQRKVPLWLHLEPINCLDEANWPSSLPLESTIGLGHATLGRDLPVSPAMTPEVKELGTAPVENSGLWCPESQGTCCRLLLDYLTAAFTQHQSRLVMLKWVIKSPPFLKFPESRLKGCQLKRQHLQALLVCKVIRIQPGKELRWFWHHRTISYHWSWGSFW